MPLSTELRQLIFLMAGKKSAPGLLKSITSGEKSADEV
jgi:type VI protein secretion system component Hcp